MACTNLSLNLGDQMIATSLSIQPSLSVLGGDQSAGAQVVVPTPNALAGLQDEVTPTGNEPIAQRELSQTPEPVRLEALAMLKSPNLVEEVISDVAKCGVAGERDLIAAIYLVSVSRLLPDPLGAIVQSPSSTGKSFVLEKVAALM